MRFLRSRGFVFGTVLLVSLLCGYRLAAVVKPAGDGSQQVPGVLWPDGKRIEPFTLLDHNGTSFERERLRGRWTLLSFGFTHCPDVCPTTLVDMRRIRERLAAPRAAAHTLQNVFVSVDPERDTLVRLKKWVTFFDSGHLGVTAEHDRLQTLTTQLGVMYEAGTPSADGHYQVRHTASLFLIDPEARLVAIFAPPHDTDQVVERMRSILAAAR